MENRNGYGIFYGVIGVATLVVAIIGATFAYFSATVTEEGAVTAGATELTLLIKDQVTTGLKNDLIPVLTTGANEALFPRYPGVETTQCKDDSGNSICSVYTFTIANPNQTTAQTVYGFLDVTSNEFSNLYFAVFKGTAAEVLAKTTTQFNVHGTAGDTNTVDNGMLVHKGVQLPKVTEGTSTQEIALPLLTEELAASGKADLSATNPNSDFATGSYTTYTVIVWLEEAGDGNNAEQGASFTANVRFTTGTGKGVTGSLSAAA